LKTRLLVVRDYTKLPCGKKSKIKNQKLKRQIKIQKEQKGNFAFCTVVLIFDF
jgi:hypothetical protein